MTKITSLTLYVFGCLFPLQVIAQNCPCCSPDFRQFDFWIGDWNVYDTTGNLVGSNEIVLMQDSCLLQENWESAKGGSGTSYNFFNKQTGKWQQVWVDNRGGVLELSGNYSEGKMVLESELQEKDGQQFFHRISWIKNDDGTVSQIWVTLDKAGKMSKLLFNGLYQQKDQ